MNQHSFREEYLRAMRQDAAVLEARRLAALPRIASGESLSAIARQLGVSRQAVHQWSQQYHRRGAAGLRRRARPGRPPKLSRQQLAQLPSLLARDAKTYGYLTAAWTSQRFADLLWKRFRVRYCRSYVSRLLRRFGGSQQKPMGDPRALPGLYVGQNKEKGAQTEVCTKEKRAA
jgi:transposase